MFEARSIEGRVAMAVLSHIQEKSFNARFKSLPQHVGVVFAKKDLDKRLENLMVFPIFMDTLEIQVACFCFVLSGMLSFCFLFHGKQAHFVRSTSGSVLRKYGNHLNKIDDS